MDLSPILARLKTKLTGFKAVGASADIDAIANGVVPVPACYLIPRSESAEDSELIGGFEQTQAVGFSIILVAANLVDPTGAAALAGLEALRNKIKGALLAWAPEPEVGEPIRFAGGELIKFEDRRLWWADEFRVTTYLRKT
jgi:hypothetical protein